jgi:diguanylate cyclase (GGDEF)-like protein
MPQMNRKLYAKFLHQTQIVAHISGRGALKRLTTAGLMVAVCLLAGFQTQAILVAAAIVTVEIISFFLNRHAANFGKPIHFNTAIAVFTINWLSIFPFASFALILAQSDTLALVLTGFVWIFGMSVHISNTFGLMPVYNWSQMVPTFGTLFGMLWVLSTNSAFDFTPQNGGVLVAVCVVYVVNTLTTMNQQNDTHRALENAREEAYSRLIELERLSRHDPLTGLMNRRAFDDITSSEIRRHADKHGVTVYLMDLDGFKPVNDTYSHRAGDIVLCAIADRLQKMVGKSGYVARLGGDEFAVLLSDIISVEEAREFGYRLINLIESPIPFEQKHLTISASIGLARQCSDNANVAGLLAGADQAMYAAKLAPNDGPVIYDKNAFPIRATLDDRSMLLAAFESNEIRPFYQPKISLDTGKIVGFEALSRWCHPTRGELLPAVFLAPINELGLQGAFTLHTAECVLNDIDKLISEGLDPGEVSVNIAEVTLATISGCDDLMSLIDRYPNIRHHLTFEITEDIFIARSSEIIQRSIARFRRAGVRISLDDFGTGFASFQHLKELEFDELKLDTGFVRDLGTDPATNVLVSGLLTMAQGLGVQVVAEGVETTDQRDTLRQMGCKIVQGYYFGKAEAFSDVRMRIQSSDPIVSRPIFKSMSA